MIKCLNDVASRFKTDISRQHKVFVCFFHSRIGRIYLTGEELQSNQKLTDISQLLPSILGVSM